MITTLLLSNASAARRRRALASLDGLSVGDGFGERCVTVSARSRALREAPSAPWLLTDDSVMAGALTWVLWQAGKVDQDLLAQRFAEEFAHDPWRGYGGTARKVLQAIGHGADWRSVTRAAFGGVGSCGNGSAMRVAPLGAYFADDLTQVVAQAALSAEVTHAHPEGAAGAIAVAAAAALLARGTRDFGEILTAVIEQTPVGKTRAGLERALTLGPQTDPHQAAVVLGNGADVTCQRTVPFCVWMAARRVGEFSLALWETVAVGGDIDTTCAIVGGILAAGEAEIPSEWLVTREPIGWLLERPLRR